MGKTEQGLFGRLVHNAWNELVHGDWKIGEGSWSAWLRTGLREMRNIFYPGGNVSVAPEYGMYGTKTPGEVAEDRRGDARDLEEEQPRGSVLEDRLAQAESRGGREERSMELER
jgi:hypothetical protein